MCVRQMAIGVVCAMFVHAGTARAQEPGPLGLVIGYPASVGVIWEVSDRLAIRPELTLTVSSGDSTTRSSTSVFQATSDNWQAGVGVSALVYVRKWDAFRTYVSPRFGYSRTQGTSITTSAISGVTFIDGGNTQSELASSAYSVSGSFGGQYALGTRFALFGEAGLAYSTATSWSGGSNVVGTNSSMHTVSTRGGAGVIIYF